MCFLSVFSKTFAELSEVVRMNEHFYSLVNKIEFLSDGPIDESSRSNLLELLESDADLRSYFFTHLKNPDWFPVLHEAGCFDASEALGPREDPDNPGYFSIPEWPVLPYLVEVTEHAGQTNNSALVAELLNIMHDVTAPPDGALAPDNPRTWWYFVKMLVALPNRFVSVEILRMIPTWLTSKFHMMLADSDICEKLLPKFLAKPAVDAEDYEKAAIIIDGITTLTDQSTDGGQSDDDNDSGRLQLLADDYWLSDSLIGKKLARKIGRLCSEDTVVLVADRLFDAVSHHFTQDPIRLSLGTDSEHRWFRIECDVTLSFRISVFASDPTKEEIEPLLTAESGGPVTTADDFKEFFESALLQDRLYARLLQDEDPMRLFFMLFGGSSYISIKSFDNRFGDYESDAEGVLTLILLEMLLGRAEAQETTLVESTESVIERLLFGKYRPAIFTRIALYVIGHRWDRFSCLFWSLLGKSYGAYYFDDIEYQAELYSILETQSRAGGFPEDKLYRLENLIDNGPIRGGSSDIQAAYWKQTWYSALKSIEGFEQKYQELKAQTQTKEDIDFRRSYFRVGHGESPLKMQELFSMSNERIVAFCTQFRNKDTRRDPTVNALADVLGAAALDNPGKFVADLEPFKASTYLFVYRLLTGLRESWKSRKTFDWERLLLFLQGYLETDEFWGNALITPDDDWRASNQWIVGEVAWLLQDATVDDDWAMPEHCHSAAEEILRLIITKFDQTPPSGDLRKDPVNKTLNSTYGRVLTALIYLSLRIARLTNDSEVSGSEVRWPASLKELFAQTIGSTTPHAYVLIGQYLPQFLYLDRAWTETQKDDFVNLSADMWYLFMYGYMFGNHQYATYYPEMIPHYERGMEATDVEENWQELFLDHLALGYMASIPEFGLTDEGFIRKLVQSWQPKKLRRVVEVIYRRPRHDGEILGTEPSDPGAKFLQLWALIYGKPQPPSAPGVPSEDEKALLSELIKLTMWMPELTEDYTNWLIQAAPYVNTRHNSAQFVEYLSYVSGRGATTTEERAKYLARIYTEMMKGYVPYYKEEHIKTIVSRIYESSEPETIELANQIVDKYARSGYHFLREIWERNNPPEDTNNEARSV